MSADDMSKELWSLANVITGFAVVQAVAVAVALGNDLARLQSAPTRVKSAISIVAAIFALGYCAGVYGCMVLALPLDPQHVIVWERVTLARLICIALFTGVLISGFFAPNLFAPSGPPDNLRKSAV